MRNFLTFKIESVLGAVFIVAFAGFFIGLFFIFMRNYDSDLSTANSVSSVAFYGLPQERILVKEWIKQNNIRDVPAGPTRMRYLINKYPDRPWTQ